MARLKCYITAKAPPKLMCMKNTALRGVSRQIQHKAKSLSMPPRAVFSIHIHSSALTNTQINKYMYVYVYSYVATMYLLEEQS